MRCITCGGYVRDRTAKMRWLGIFGLLFAINAAVRAAKTGIEDPILPAVRWLFLFTLGYSAGIFGVAFLLSLFAKTENQLKVCAVIALVIASLVVLVDLGVVR